MLETVHGKVVSFPPARSHLQILTSYSNFSSRTASLLPVWEEVPSSLVCRGALAVSEERPRSVLAGWRCTEDRREVCQRARGSLGLQAWLLVEDLLGSHHTGALNTGVGLPSCRNLQVVIISNELELTGIMPGSIMETRSRSTQRK